MANLNKVLLIGRLTKDPELRYTPSGTAVCDITLAVSRNYTTADGKKMEDTCFADVTLWKRQAELCTEYLKKGREVFIEGRLINDRWETSDGQKRSKLKIVALGMQFLGRPPARDGEKPPAAEHEPPEHHEHEEQAASGSEDHPPF
ncbi:MAG: hypothetical protein A2Z34_02995 [Planctomycetes bacterium RBG_16_59_8]|nr:MAG: hypothetical protein A2Z34_02995 [Planctomycetes bacterium RBG_16_59_8]